MRAAGASADGRKQGYLTQLVCSAIVRHPMTAAEIVPEDVLAPPDAHARGFHRHDAALLLDGWLRRLAGQEARCRAVLGGLARAFLRRRGQSRLGFARVEDYARERLGMSGRELHSLATVMGRMGHRPCAPHWTSRSGKRVRPETKSGRTRRSSSRPLPRWWRSSGLRSSLSPNAASRSGRGWASSGPRGRRVVGATTAPRPGLLRGTLSSWRARGIHPGARYGPGRDHLGAGRPAGTGATASTRGRLVRLMTALRPRAPPRSARATAPSPPA